MSKAEASTTDQAAPSRPAPRDTTASPRHRDDHYYRLLAGTAKTRLLESLFDLRLPQLWRIADH
jgi:hypothetical protein